VDSTLLATIRGNPLDVETNWRPVRVSIGGVTTLLESESNL